MGATVRNENGFELRFDVWSDGPYPCGYRLNGLSVSEQRVPQADKDELYGLAWDHWRQRGHGDYEQ